MASSFINSTTVKVHPSAPKVAYSINCSLCGCNGASVRCEKCNSMAFCIGCDDMYHRHPKRRNHLRQAVALEFLQALEKHQQQQQQFADERQLKSPVPAKVDNQSLYPWRRPRTMPRMPDNFPTSPTPTQLASLNTASKPVNAPVNNNWAPHPSKMPVPPPRRKKKLSFSGLKDTFRKFVNPNHYKNHQEPEPIYATIQRPIPTLGNSQTFVQTNGKPANGSIASAFRPLPALPNEQQDQVYENTRKNSLPMFADSQAAKKKQFASTFDLREYENFVRSNGFDPNNLVSNVPLEVRSSTLPRKNFSCQDISSQNATLNHQTVSGSVQPQMVEQPWNGCVNCSAHSPHQVSHGSTQSLFPGFFPGGPHPHAQLFSPNMFAGGYPSATGCANCTHFSAHHWGCSQSVANMAGLACGQCNRYPNGHSLANSMEELHGRHPRPFDDEEDELSEDEEDDEAPRRVKNRSRKASSASTASHIRRTQSSYSMYPNLENGRGSHCPSPNPNYANYPTQGPVQPVPLQSLRSHNSSPSPSVKSYSGVRTNDRYQKNVDNMSDSSSSQDVILNSPKRPEFSGILTNGNRKLSTSSSSASSARFREPLEVLQRSQRQQEPTNYCVEEPEMAKELVNDHGQWSCRFCTFFNDAEKNICDICAKTRKNPRIVVQAPKLNLATSSKDYSKQSPTSVPSISSLTNGFGKATVSPTKPSQASPSAAAVKSTENEFVFDEKLIHEQMEIERELARRRENERRIEEENRKLAELSEEQKNREAELRNREIELKNREAELKKAQLEQSLQAKAVQPEVVIKSKDTASSPVKETVDHEKFVARIIEEKISEKLSLLKLNSASTASLNKIDQPEVVTKLEEMAESSKVVPDSPQQADKKPNNLASLPKETPPNAQPEMQSSPLSAPPAPTQTPVSTQPQVQYQQPESNFINPYQPSPSAVQQPNGISPYSNDLQSVQQQALPYGANPGYAYQQNSGYSQQQPNQTPIPSQGYPSQRQVPSYPPQYGSNQYLNQFAMQPQPSQPLIGGIGGGYSQPNQGHPPYQRHQSFSSESNSSLISKSMNRFSSFDDLQSMSSVTSAGSLYGRSDSQKGHMESGLHIIQTLRDAEKKGYTADDVEVAIQFSPGAPLDWLDDNWANMCETVLTMANNQIIEMERASAGKSRATNFRAGLNLVTEKDARLALRICKGNIWQAVEKCIQRYEDNKAGFSTPLSENLKAAPTTAGGKFSGAIPKASKSFSLKVSGFGNGKANNDAYDPGQEEAYDDEVFDGRSDVAEEEVENSMNPDFLFKEAPNQSPMDAFLSSQANSETTELLDFYVRKLTAADGLVPGQLQFDREQMEALIYNWRYEKMVLDAEREQLKRADKEKRKMQKMLDLQRRIGGYLSDGTTTEEELDREVEQVFASHEELRAKLAGIEAEDEYSSDTTTHVAEDLIVAGPSGPSGANSATSESSTKTLQEELEEEDDQFDEIERRMQSRLESLLQTSEQRQGNVTNVTLIDASLPSKAIAAKQTAVNSAQPKAPMVENVVPTVVSENVIESKSMPVSVKESVNVTTEMATSASISQPILKITETNSEIIQKSVIEKSVSAPTNVSENVQQVQSSQQIAHTEMATSTAPIEADPLEIVSKDVKPIPDVSKATPTAASQSVILNTHTPVSEESKPIPLVTQIDSIEATVAFVDQPIVEIVSVENDTVASSTVTTATIELDKQPAQTMSLNVSPPNQNAPIESDSLVKVDNSVKETVKQSPILTVNEQPNQQIVTQEPVVERNEIISNQASTSASTSQIQSGQVSEMTETSLTTSLSTSGTVENSLHSTSGKATAPTEGRKVKKIKVKKVKAKEDSSAPLGVEVPKLLEPRKASTDSVSSVEQATVIEKPKETVTVIAPKVVVAKRELASPPTAKHTPHQRLSDGSSLADEFAADHQPVPVPLTRIFFASSLPVPQAPVFSKLKGSDRQQTAHLRKSAPNLLKIMSVSSENIASNMDDDNGDSFGEFKEKVHNGTFNWGQSVSKGNSRTVGSLFKSKSIDFDSTEMEECSIEQMRRKRARNVILHKLKSLDSVHSISATNLLEPFSHATSRSNSSLLTNGSTPSFYSPNKEDPFETLATEAQENPPADVRWSRLDYGVDFEWARTEFECELCTNLVPVQDIVSMISCTHFACRDCLRQYFTVQIRERHRLVITCPFCEEPSIGADEDEKVFEYLGMFDPFIRHIIEPDVYELFQRKLRDRALMRDPNFLWCAQCSSGFISPNPVALTVMCPDCRTLTCRKCKKPWKKQHFNLSCEAYSTWEMSNDPQFAEQQLNKHLKEFGIECPNCKFRYQLAKGGCMHFRCIQCSYDFCGGCSRPFKLGNRCFRARMCCSLGLHAHHPRNCLFYLRDKEIADLQRLLKEHNIEYTTELEGDQKVTRCQVMEQKETDNGMKDEPCNRFVESAGLCKLHYKEYLGTLIYQNKVDPISIFSEVELELVLRRENIRYPNQKVLNAIAGSNPAASGSKDEATAKADEEYRGKLVEIILDRVPLDLWE